MTVLVVDDQENMCWVLSRILADAGFSVQTAGTAEKALSMFAEDTISAAIIDYRLPDKNGLELFSEMRRRDPQIPAILITSYGSEQLHEKALQLGFHAYLDKPFGTKALVAALQEAMRGP